MKLKNYLITAIVGALCFIIGYYFSTAPQQEKKTQATITKKEQMPDTSNFRKADDHVNPVKKNTERDYSKELKGKYILAGADYAGYEFIDAKTISWTNEIFPMDPDTMTLKWIDNNTFITKFTKRINQNCSPNIGVLKVESYDGHKLILKDFWTGWGDSKDDSKTFYTE